MNTRILFFSMASLAAMTACSELDEKAANSIHDKTLTSISSGSSKFGTRFNNETGKWEKGDAIGVFMLNSDNTSAFEGGSNVQFTTEEEAASVTFKSSTGIPVASESASFYAYYPYSTGVDEEKFTYPIQVADQSTGIAASDLMWARKMGVSADDLKNNGLSLTFSHSLAMVKINLTVAQSVGTVENTTIAGLGTTGTFKLTTGELSADDTPGIIQPYKLKDNTYEAIILPTKTPQNMTLNFYAGGKKYQYTMSSSAITEFKAGYQYLFNIGIGASVEGTLTEILGDTTPWGNETVEKGDAGEVESAIPDGYAQIHATSADGLANALKTAAGKVAVIFDNTATYEAFNSLQVPESVTDLLLLCEGDNPARVQLSDLSFGTTLQSLTFQNLEISGNKNTNICNGTSRLAEQGSLTLKDCYIHNVNAVYNNTTGSEYTDLPLASFNVENTRIYHAGCILSLHNVNTINVKNSTLYDISERAFYPTNQNVSFNVSRCTLVQAGQTPFEAKGRRGSIDYTGCISNLSVKNICYGVTPGTVEGNYAVSGSCKQLSGKASDGIDDSRDLNAIFTHPDTEGDFSTTLNAGDPRWTSK